jgi:hypothetical protein
MHEHVLQRTSFMSKSLGDVQSHTSHWPGLPTVPVFTGLMGAVNGWPSRSTPRMGGFEERRTTKKGRGVK